MTKIRKRRVMTMDNTEFQWVAKPSLKVRRMLRKDGWRVKPGYGSRTGIILMERARPLPPKMKREDVVDLRDYLNKWLAEHR